MMRAISNNMTEHSLFLSTPKFISDLLFVSEVLKGIEKEERDGYLKQVIEEINKNLPANVYIPIRQETTNLPDPAFLSKYKKSGKLRQPQPGHIKQRIGPTRMHRVLRISTDNAFCLHSKERVPYHIIIEVAYEPVSPKKQDNEEEKVAESDGPFTHRVGNDNQDGKAIWPVKKLKNLASAAQRKRSAGKGRKASVELEEVKQSRFSLTNRGGQRSKSFLSEKK